MEKNSAFTNKIPFLNRETKNACYRFVAALSVFNIQTVIIALFYV